MITLSSFYLSTVTAPTPSSFTIHFERISKTDDLDIGSTDSETPMYPQKKILHVLDCCLNNVCFSLIHVISPSLRPRYLGEESRDIDNLLWFTEYLLSFSFIYMITFLALRFLMSTSGPQRRKKGAGVGLLLSNETGSNLFFNSLGNPI